MSENSYFVDTNILLRVIAKDDKRKTKDCEAFIESLIRGDVRGVVSSLVLAEFAWTCRSFYKLHKSEFLPAMKALLEMKYLSVRDDHDHALALRLYESHSVKFIDALIASHAAIAHEHLPVLSYDRDFDALGVRRVEPGDILSE